ncbi:hypothetical protein [Pyxidicoccus sp. MSG2]|uniref:hypothetical protein n=1 Tax=Pyxidicoccus sp. MSG2 TaxID=2996790 RepID=UPI002271D317|nr:hypothetical protein [Pyxidicoccus sp. MSG2]MCY1023405.1 hypothetical protein [Pyxidicoccus sp. MSG2]
MTKIDPVFDKLERARRDLKRESSSMGGDSQMLELLALNAGFVALFLGSAWLLQRGAHGRPA